MNVWNSLADSGVDIAGEYLQRSDDEDSPDEKTAARKWTFMVDAQLR